MRYGAHFKILPTLLQSSLQADARRIEMVVERNYPWGTKLKHETSPPPPPLQADARRIEMVVERNYPWGTKLKHEIKGRLPPEVSITLRQIGDRLPGKV